MITGDADTGDHANEAAGGGKHVEQGRNIGGGENDRGTAPAGVDVAGQYSASGKEKLGAGGAEAKEEDDEPKSKKAADEPGRALGPSGGERAPGTTTTPIDARATSGQASGDGSTNVANGADQRDGASTGAATAPAVGEPGRPPAATLMGDKEREELRSIIDQKHGHYRRRAYMWGACYQTSLYISAILSAAAALALKLDFLTGWTYKEDFSAIAAGLVAIITILTAAGGFHRRWRVNRAAASSMFQLQTEVTRHDANGYNIRNKIKEIVKRYEKEVVGPEVL